MRRGHRPASGFNRSAYYSAPDLGDGFSPLTGLTIVLIKETAILSVITVPELLYEVQGMTTETFQYLEPFAALILGYWALAEGAAWAGRRFEAHVTVT